jgi:dTDP-glucose 4,6-dehydratase
MHLKFVAKQWEGKRFYHVSTDEVYGSLGQTRDYLKKRRPMTLIHLILLKASSDHFVRAYGETYGLSYVINCSNNYGQNHFSEKLIPLFINNIINNKYLFTEMGSTPVIGFCARSYSN